MNKQAGIWIAGGVLAALGVYFVMKQQASAGTLSAGALPAGGTLASATGIGAPSLSSNVGLTNLGLPSGIASMLNPLGQTIYIDTATSAPTASGISSSMSFWNTLSPISSPPSGWIIDPAGTQGVATLLPWRVDSNGNKYVLWGVDVYQAQGPDASGNYTALPVARTSSSQELGFAAGG